MRSFLGQTSWRYAVIMLILITLLFSGCRPFNDEPVINGIKANKDYLYPADTCIIRAVAYDGDGDELRYQWASTDGEIHGEGATVVWTAPDRQGTYTITVKVIDGQGGEDVMTLSLAVRPNNPPVIVSLIAEESVCRATQTVPVECVAYDPDGDNVSYQWACDDGDISGQGPSATWTAPGAPGSYTITVSVTDNRGGEASEEVVIEVRSG